jgi:hypothetical protein
MKQNIYKCFLVWRLFIWNDGTELLSYLHFVKYTLIGPELQIINMGIIFSYMNSKSEVFLTEFFQWNFVFYEVVIMLLSRHSKCAGFVCRGGERVRRRFS